MCPQKTGHTNSDLEGLSKIGLDAEVEDTSLLLLSIDTKDYNVMHVDLELSPAILQVPASPDIYTQSMASIYLKLLGGSADGHFASVLSAANLQNKLLTK